MPPLRLTHKNRFRKKKMRKIVFALLILWTALQTQAQERNIVGRVIDAQSKESLPYMTVQLLKTDSTFVGGAITKDDGSFSLKAPGEASFLLRVSGVGYATTVRRIRTNGTRTDVGTLPLKGESVMLQGAEITAQANKVTMREDTFVYNSAAYRTPEGSAIEELVKRLPGATVSDDGKITINGKEVKKILVDGKEFFADDPKTTLKNLPTSIVNTVKAYDEKSDMTKVTGIDDGNETTVLDFGLKKGMNKGMFANIDLGAGTKSRYADRFMGAYFNDRWKVMGFGNFNNVNDMGFGGRGGQFGRNRNGLNAAKMAGININYEEKDKLKVNGNVRWNHSDSDNRMRSSSENYISKTGAFSNSISQSYGREDSWRARFRIEWQPDTLTNILFRPRLTVSTSDGLSSSLSASYNEDPYNYTDSPLASDSLTALAQRGLLVNRRQRISLSYGRSSSAGGMLLMSRKLNAMGRNISVRAEAEYTKNRNTGLALNNVHLYQLQSALGGDSTYQTNRYNLSPSTTYNYSVEATYSEPLWKATFLQFIYGFEYSYSKSDRSTYDFSNMGEDFFGNILPAYRSWSLYLNRLPNPLSSYYDKSLSRYSEYSTYTHDIEVMFRMIREKFNFNAGVMFKPQQTKFVQDYQGTYTDTVRKVINVTPTLDFNYKFSKESNLRINYRGTTAQPSITDLLDITDNSDPLNIYKGNPGLKPSFTQSLRLFFNRNNVAHYQQVMASWFNFNTTRNSISTMVTYDPVTGGRTSQPQNINGQWSMGGGVMFNTALDSAGYWNVNTHTFVDYQNYVGYVNLDRSASAQKNNTRDFSIMERLAASYRNSWLEVELDGSVNYRNSKNDLQASSNSNVWQFAYGMNVNLTAPWGTSVSTDLHQNSRRGYSDASLNTNELIWNVQLAHSFLKGKAMTVSLQFYDLLHEQSNLTRAISAMQRSDTEYNSINSYAMLHLSYKLNIFGGKQARDSMPPHNRGDRQPDFNRPDMRRPGNGMPAPMPEPARGFGGIM